MDKKNRIKKFFLNPVVQDAGKTASSGLVEALKQADGIATLVPVPALKLALQSLLALIQAVDQTAQNSDVAKRLQNRIESLTTSILIPVEQVDLKDMPKELVIELDRLAKIFEINVTNCRVKISHGWFRRFIRRDDDQGDVANMSKGIDEAVAQFLSVGTIKSVETIVQVKRGVDELREQNQIKQIISKKAENANHLYQSAQSAQRSECLEGTRVTVLQQIRAFLEDTTGANLFWLSGIAGSGKSTIAQSAAVEATLWANCVVASFFFSRRGHAELCDASFVFPTLAYQFSLADAGFRKHVSGIIKEHPDIFEKDFISQFKSLIVEPLKAMDFAQRHVFIVLDAFDECEPRGATAILNALLNKDIDVPKELKVLTTSRPEAHLRKVFCAQDKIPKLNLQDIEAKSDIHHYLLTTFKQPPIALAAPFDASEEVISKLAESAGDSFIYAASILRFIFDEHDQHPRRRLEILLGNRTDPEERPHERLDTLYLSILHHAVPAGAKSSVKRRLRTVLGQLVTFREPLPMAVMEKFCELESDDVKRALHNLHSLIQVPDSDNQAPRVYHLSFSDFIIDPTRCEDADLVVDVDSAEREVLRSCFDHLSLRLDRNMAGIEDPSLPHSEIDDFQTKVENAVSPELRYACLYWASHLMKNKDPHDEKIWPRLQDFLTRCLLWWIETMALLGTLGDAVESMSQVRAWMTSLKREVGCGSSLLADLVNDAFRFISYHGDTISFNALHVYHSALPFTPTETQLRKIYAHELEISVKVLHGIERGWDPTVMVMRHEEPICGVSWSPNGRFVALAGPKSIEIRDALIGSSVVSIDLPKPLLYSSSFGDMDAGHRLKESVHWEIRPMPIGAQKAKSGLMEAFERAEDTASLAPVPGLENVLSSSIALIHAGYGLRRLGLEDEDEDERITKTKLELELLIKSFTEVVLMQFKEESSDVPRQVVNDLEEFTRTIEVITATLRQTLSEGGKQGRSGASIPFALGINGKSLGADFRYSLTSLLWYPLMLGALQQFMKKETIPLLDSENVVEVKWIERDFRLRIIESLEYIRATQRAEFLEGTRTAVLDEIFAWLEDPSAARIFRLSGIAGSGKSAVVRLASIRAALLADHIVVSVFFSQFGHAGLFDPSSVFQTFAFQFSLLDIGYKERVSEVINEDPNIFEKDLRFQYEKLIIQTLGAIRRPHGRILIILDGLDECEPHEVTAVLKVLLADDIDHPKDLKILTASRPEVQHLRGIFDAQSDIRKLSLEEVETESDILFYLRTSFEQPPTYLVNPFTVPEETISELAKRAGNSFIYAATIVRFIFDKHFQDPQRRIDFLLSIKADPEDHPGARLDALFLGILQQALPLGASDDEKRRLRTVLGLLVCLREPFPMDKMEALYELEPGDVRRALLPLHSLVDVPDCDEEAPCIYSRSFTDFVVDPARCLDRNLVVDIGSNEKRIFNACSSFDHDDIDWPFSAGGKYACLYWASHLTKIKDVDESTQYHLDGRFLLRWIEAMALLGIQREAVTHIHHVRAWITSLKGQADKASNRLVDLMDNASRLLLHHATITSCDSLLIYDSALFTPAYLEVHEQLPPLVVEVGHNSHNPRFDYCEVVRHTDPVSSLVPLFRMYNDFMQVFAWSPNSRLIAVSRVNGIDIRDALSGSIVDSFDLSPSLENVLDPKKVSRQCFAFYPDNSRIAYITRGGRVQVRNTLARTEEFAVTGHEAGLVSINVSPNGELLVSASNWGYIQVCNAENGDLLWAVDTGTRLKSTSISPNSRLIVSLSYSPDHGVQIWNAIDGLPLITLPHEVITISFSPDSNQLASVDEEGLVRVWGTSQTTTAPIQEWSIGALPACLVFSPDGSKLAAAADDNVYILRRGADDFAMLDGHTDPVTSLAFSADGMTLASGSLDGAVRVWDVSSIETDTLRVMKDKQVDWHDVSWSPKGQVVMASNFRESKAWIWNTQDGTSRVLEDCLPVAISDCGKYFATHSSSRTQNTETITTRGIASDVAQSISFSFSFKASPDSLRPKFFPNSTRFAAISGKEIFTWDASVAHPEVTRLVGHSEKLFDLHTVPDGSRLLSRAGEEVFAWNVDTLQLVSRTGNVIPAPRYHSPIGTTKDNWVVLTLPDNGGLIRLFRLPSGYRPYILSTWSITVSWLSKCILIRSGNGNVFIVDISALSAVRTIDLTN